MPLEDVGPAGADQGKGGKYVILPPGYKEKVPDGYIPLPSPTWLSYALIRSNLAGPSDVDITKAVAYGQRLQVYPLSHAASPPPTRFTDAADVLFDSTIPYDVRFFESLNRVVQNEPWLERDKAMIDPLKSLGIEKGKLFTLTATTTAALEAGAREAHAWFNHFYETGLPPYFDGTHWAVPAQTAFLEEAAKGYTAPDVYPIDARGLTYYMGYIGIKHLGAGQFYLMTHEDNTSHPLNGADTYRLTVPPDVPVKLYWSATVYDRATHALIRDVSRASRSSRNAQKNADGSVDVYFGPHAPEGKDPNWVPTQPGGQFEVLFRFYGPQKPLFDKTWKLPDVEQVP